MDTTVVWALIFGSFGLGAVLGARIGEKHAEKEYQDRLEALQNERNEFAKEVRETRQKAVESREKRLAELSQKYHDNDFDEHFSERVSPDDDEPVDEPRLITEEEFRDSLYLDRKDCTLEYYQDDGILVDDNGSVIDNQLEVLGSEAIGILDTTDEDYIYVQNDAYETNYEVCIEHGVNYYRDVLGVQ